VLFIAGAVANAGMFFALINHLVVVHRLDNGELVSRQEALDADQAVADVASLLFGLAIAIFVLMIIWLHRAYGNVDAFRVGPKRYGNGWTVGAWFIPVANLWIPNQLISDTWRGADAAALGNPRWTKLPRAPIIMLWWVFFIAAAVFSYPRALTDPDSSADALQVADALSAVGALVSIVAAILGAITFRTLTRRQHERAEALQLLPR
jgi:hypothetical protein